MDIEQLSKTQIVLLTLLVAFVSSIATGIVTVSLVSQAPEGITQTINRIVERTVEKVVTEPAKSVAAAVTGNAAATEKTVVVKEDDLTADSIAKVQASTVRIVARGSSDSSFYARGIIVDPSGAIATDRGSIDPNLLSEAIFPSGARYPVTPRTPAVGSSVIILDPSFIGTTTPKFSPVSFADMGKLRLGQSVVRIGGRAYDAVSTGVIASLPNTQTDGEHLIETTINSTIPGSIIITIFGDVIGMTTGNSLLTGGTLYTPASAVSAALAVKSQ